MFNDTPPAVAVTARGISSWFYRQFADVEKSVLMNQLSNKAVEQKTLYSPLLMVARHHDDVPVESLK